MKKCQVPSGSEGIFLTHTVHHAYGKSVLAEVIIKCPDFY